MSFNYLITKSYHLKILRVKRKKLGIVAIANPQIRSVLTRRLEQNCIDKFSLISDDFISFQNVTIGAGSIIAPVLQLHVTLRLDILSMAT